MVVSDLLLQGGDNGLDVLAALERHPNGIGPGTARLLVTGETKPDRLREVASAGRRGALQARVAQGAAPGDPGAARRRPAAGSVGAYDVVT